jgi:hypothetical protein
MEQAQNSAQWRYLFLTALNLRFLLSEMYSIRYPPIKETLYSVGIPSLQDSVEIQAGIGRRIRSRITETWPRVGPASTRVPRLSFVLLGGSELSIVCSAPWFCWRKLRRIVTACPAHTSVKQRNYSTPLLIG